MNRADLYVLWAISNGSTHGYEIKKKLEKAISGMSCYQALRRMRKKGFLTESSYKPSNYPQRLTYALEDKGVGYYHDLCLASEDPEFAEYKDSPDYSKLVRANLKESRSKLSKESLDHYIITGKLTWLNKLIAKQEAEEEAYL